MKELIKLQKQRKIVIKRCDKGAGIIILNFHEYSQACLKHLDKKQGHKNHYRKVTEHDLEVAKAKLTQILDEGIDNDILTKAEYHAMCPDGKGPGRFYSNLKVHKEHVHGEVPPVRPIISGNNSILENPRAYVEHHIAELATKHESYIKDTPDFLRKVEEEIIKEELPDNSILVTVDVKALFTNIKHKEGAKATKEALNLRHNKTVPTGFIMRILEFVLNNNIFEFDGQLYSQDI